MTSRRPAIFSIPPHAAFADALAAGLLAGAGGDQMALARTLVLLPNRRAATAVTEAFVRQMGDAGLLLPRLVPVGDLDDGGFDRLVGGDAPLAPAVPPLQRRMELTRLVRQLEPTRAAVELLRLGDALCRTLDTLLEAEVDPARLDAAVADADLAGHWEKTQRFLEVIIRTWPAARGPGTEGRTRLAATIDAAIARWQARPPGPVVAAGITNATPPFVRLLRCVLGLPGGMVVLPGVDCDASPAGQARWDAIRCGAEGHDPQHPQWAMKHLLCALDLDRSDVRPWGTRGGTADGPPARDDAVQAAMAPAGASAVQPRLDAGAFTGIRIAECATGAEEAQLVALALREALETPGRRAALVTPDRVLARRVAVHCRRWGIAVDDSAGTPLRLMPPGALLLALVDAMAAHFAPVALLGLLKHPLVGGTDSARTDWLAEVRQLDLALRGVRPAPGLDGIAAAIADRRDEAVAGKRQAQAGRLAALGRWWDDVADRLAPLAGLGDRAVLLPELAAALREVTEALAQDRAWRGADGRMLAQRLADIEAHGGIFGPLAAAEAPALIAGLIAECDVRVPHAGHPRLSILGPVEAQLTRADLMILSGLNEGTWPDQPAPDPWLAPAVRRELGLAGTAATIGLAGMDFVRALGAPEVLLTRARRTAAGPQVPSRLWLRLAAASGGLPERSDLIAAARAIDGGAAPRPQPRPAPAPPPELRPDALSITDLDTLVADPFAYHARAILKLRPLDPLDQDPTARLRGEVVHAALEDWIKAGRGSLAQLAQLAEARLQSEARHFPLLQALWLPRARRAILWAGERILELESEWPHMYAEASGTLALPNGITVRGRADRVDRSADGRMVIVDYKTGTPPANKRVLALEANQLALGLAMATSGVLVAGDAPVKGGLPHDMQYWQLIGGRDDKRGKITSPMKARGAPPIDDHVCAVLDEAERLTSHYLLSPAPFVPKLRPAASWSDYDHLARVAEWLNRPQGSRP